MRLPKDFASEVFEHKKKKISLSVFIANLLIQKGKERRKEEDCKRLAKGLQCTAKGLAKDFAMMIKATKKKKRKSLFQCPCKD